jgi:hypothetical protein
MMTDHDPADALSLILRRVIHPMARDNYRVIWNGFEVGSIGLQVGAGGRTFWHWGIDTVTPRLPFATHGDTLSKDEAMAAFRAAWNEYAADPDRMRHKVEVKAGRLSVGDRAPIDHEHSD